MPAPLAALGGIFGKGALVGGKSALAGVGRQVAMGAAGSIKDGVRNKIRSGITGGKKKKRIKKPNLSSGIVKQETSAENTSPGGAIVPYGMGRGGALTTTPKSETSIVKPAKTSSFVDILSQIQSVLDEILQLEKEESAQLKESISDQKEQEERARRDEEQERQEQQKKKPSRRTKENPVVTGAKKAVGGIFDFIAGLVGDFIKFKILDWFSDPKNKKNVQRLVEFFKGVFSFLGMVYDNFVKPFFSLMTKILPKTFDVFRALLQSVIDIFTLKWLTNPKEFIDNLAKIPQTILALIPTLFSAITDFITGGLFDNVGKFVSDIIDNFNPFKLIGNLFGFGGDEGTESEEASPTPQKPKQNSSDTKQDGGFNILNPFSWFGESKESVEQSETKDGDIPKLAKGGIVGKESESGPVTVEPLSNLIRESKLSQMISDGIKPFMDLMLAPFKIIGTAIVGLVLRTVSKIPFVGSLVEPIITMAASTFGVPSEVLTQLRGETKKDLPKEIEKEEILDKLMVNAEQVVQTLKSEENIFSGITNILGSVGNVLGGIFDSITGGAAHGKESPLRMPTTPSAPSLPSYSSHADAGNAGVSQYTNTETGKSYQKNEDESGWSEMETPTQTDQGPGMATFGETGNVSNAAGWVHGHFQTNNGTVEDLINDTAPLVKQVADNGVPVELSNGTSLPANSSMNDVKSFIRDGVNQHTHSGDGRSVDIFVPKGTPVPFPLTDVRTAGGNEGRSGILPGTGKVWVGHLTKDSQSGGQHTPMEPKDVAKSVTPTGSKTGPALTEAQETSMFLSAIGHGGNKTPTIFSTSPTTNSSATENGGDSSLGSTLPTTGLWSVYKTNL